MAFNFKLRSLKPKLQGLTNVLPSDKLSKNLILLRYTDASAGQHPDGLGAMEDPSSLRIKALKDVGQL